MPRRQDAGDALAGATAIELGEDGLLAAVFEQVRRGGPGLVVDPIDVLALRPEFANVAAGVDP